MRSWNLLSYAHFGDMTSGIFREDDTVIFTVVTRPAIKPFQV